MSVYNSTLNVLLGLSELDYSDLVFNAPYYYKQWWLDLVQDSPQHVFVETVLVMFIIWLVFVKKTVDPRKAALNTKLTQKEIKELMEWEPEPLVPDQVSRDASLLSGLVVIDQVDGNYIVLEGNGNKRLLNLTSNDFLGMSQLPAVKEASEAALKKYGCGSCGPRGFYGTIDKHLNFERDMAKFMGTDDAISYSDGASTVNSTIPAFAKKGDLLIIDDAVSEPIRTGAVLSRATVHYFKHNDMENLENILSSIASDDKKFRRKTTEQRRFIIVEGLYRSTGNVCNLPKILEFKNKFFYRLMVDESLSFGAIGKTGKGVTEYWNVPLNDVEIITIAMDTALASVGGICIGSREIVDHQRLSGAGYCYSAAAPPFLSAAACQSLKCMENDSSHIEAMRKNVELFRNLMAEKAPKLQLPSHPESPLVHVQLSLKDAVDWATDEEKVFAWEKEIMKREVWITAARYHTSILREFMKNKRVRPSLRVHLHSRLTADEVERAVIAIKEAAKKLKLTYK